MLNSARTRLAFLQIEFPHSGAAAGEIGEPHLRVLSRKDHTFSSRFESGQCRGVDVLRRGFLLPFVGWNVYVNSRIDLALTLNAFKRALGFTQNIIRR